MRKVILLAVTAAMAHPAFAKVHDAERVSVQQLEQTLATLHGEPDGRAAQLILGVELTERLSTLRLARLESELPGPKTRQALIAIADASAFFNLPSDEIPAAPVPDRETLSSLLGMVREYVARTIPRLPNFFATRETTRFENTPSGVEPGRGALSGAESAVVYEPGGEPARGTTAPNFSIVGDYQPLHVVGSSRVTVLYRDRHEFTDAEGGKGKSSEVRGKGLSTAGEFGPILVTWLVDSMKGQVTWGHWEQGATGVQAVFRYSVPRPASHYTVVFPGVINKTQYVPGYHGEIAVNPKDGTVLRLTMVADMQPGDLVALSNIAVEYGPVEVGGMSYICPVKSVAVSLTRYVPPGTFSASSGEPAAPGPMQTQVNDVIFTQYHLFRSEARVLTGDDPEPGGTPPPSSTVRPPNP